MLFTDAIFLFYFLPLVLILHRLLAGEGGGKYPVAARWFLVSATLIFYGWNQPWWVAPFFVSAGFDYFWVSLLLRAKALSWRRLWLVLSITQNILLLSLFKYRDFFSAQLGFPMLKLDGVSLVVPAGISFYTFESLSFVIDCYRGKINKRPSLTRFLGFLAMFPRFVIGPITRYPEISSQMDRYAGAQLERGLTIFAWGFFQKICIADQLALFTHFAFSGESHSVAGSWLGLLSYTLQLYFDFSGYSSMAIGLGYCLGFSFPNNFDRPFQALSLGEFWRRWHQSLSFWMRDYIYYPLRGQNPSRAWIFLCLLTTMLLTGAWHGQGWIFIVFGLFHGVILCVERLLARPLGRSWTFIIFALSMVLFRSENLEQASGIYRDLVFGRGNFDWSYIRQHWLNFCVAMGAGVYVLLEAKIPKDWERPEEVGLGRKIFALASLLIGITLLFGGQKIPFLYFQF